MKKFSMIAGMAIFTVATFFVSCSNEESISDTSTISTKGITTNSIADNYVKTFYKTAYSYGRSIETKEEDGTTLVIDEVIVNGQGRGYVVTQKSNGAFLYFGDVDRTAKVMKSYEARTNTTESLNLSQHPDYSTSNGFDVIKIVNDLNNGQTPYLHIKLPKFWGPGRYNVGGVQSGINPDTGKPGCWQTVQQTKTRFFYTYDVGNPMYVEVPC